MIGKICLVLACAVFGINGCPPNGLGGFGSCGCGLGGLGAIDFSAYGYNLPCGLGSYGLGLQSPCGLGLGSYGLLPSCPSNAGPCPAPLPVVNAPPVVIPDCPSPIIELPTPPAPPTKVLDNRCVCTKTVVKPQVYQRVVSVPSVNRFLKKSYCPVIEKIPYTANPVSDCGTCGCGSCGCGSCGCGLPLNGPCGLPLPGSCGIPISTSCGLQCPNTYGFPTGCSGQGYPF